MRVLRDAGQRAAQDATRRDGQHHAGQHHQREAEIVAQAGRPGAVTIATNMAGRGTDIRLGEGVAEMGGLQVILTEMHDAARIDRLAAEALALSHERPGDDRLLHTLAEAVVRCLPADAPGTGEDHRLALFRQLLEVHLREHRSLDFYASRLRITPRSLHRLCQKQLGCSPLALINRRLAIEAQRLLRYTNASVAEVAAELGYADASYFSRGYLRQTGRRPSAERA